MRKFALILLALALGSAACRGMTKDNILSVYDAAVGLAGRLSLTPDIALAGERELAGGPYFGSYRARCTALTGSETLFGGTSALHAPDAARVTCKLNVESGRASLFLDAGGERTVLFAANGGFSRRVALPSGGCYLGIDYEDFTGSVELSVEE